MEWGMSDSGVFIASSLILNCKKAILLHAVSFQHKFVEEKTERKEIDCVQPLWI